MSRISGCSIITHELGARLIYVVIGIVCPGEIVDAGMIILQVIGGAYAWMLWSRAQEQLLVCGFISCSRVSARLGTLHYVSWLFGKETLSHVEGNAGIP